jgi:two-component system chemotaxis sensor kinase CheA
MDAYRDVFFAESADFIQQVIDGLLSLEAAPHDLGPVEVVFRGAHSLKGMAAAMGYERTAELTHRMESLMDRVRKGSLTASSDVVSLMLAAVDLVRELIDDESTGGSAVDSSEMLAALEAATDARGEEAMSAEPDAVEAGGFDPQRTWTIAVTLEEGCVLKAVRAYMVLKRLAHMGRIVETHPDTQDIEDERFNRTFEVVIETESTPAQLEEACRYVSEVGSVGVEPFLSAPLPTPRDLGDARAPRTSLSKATQRRDLPRLSQSQTVRVAIGHLDTLVDLVGELVILRSRLEGLARRNGDVQLIETVDEFQRISTDLQYQVMRTRMVPVGNIFNRFPRMVRDLASELGKSIDFRMAGLDIELDRTVLDEIGDPLVHLLRNSVDHGIEPAEERERAGKPAIGTITLSANRERDHVAIVVGDDGRGMDIDRVWMKAVECGLVSADTRCDYDDADILHFTCAPGFSTVDAATRLSGRGVGMDVVKGKIEYLGGTLQIRSQPSQGTEFVLRLPLTLAIVQALLVEARGQTFALPLSSVDEVFSAEDMAIDTVDGAPVVILRDGTLVPLQRLDAMLFGVDPRTPVEPGSSIVLVQSGIDQCALQVDSLAGRQEIVVKPLSRLFTDSKGFSGATILGDGRVLLILDPRALSSTEV